MAAIVVVLSREQNLARDEFRAVAAASLKCIRVTTAYEAAAEVLAAPVSALLIDLRCLSQRHLRLLEIARDMDIEMLAVDSLPTALTAEQLNGVKLIAMRSLPGELARICSVTLEAGAVGMPAPQPVEVPLPPVVPPSVPAVELAPAKQPAPAEKPAVGDETIEGLLSSEEIAALLGDQS